jgi:hypothetical protein
MTNGAWLHRLATEVSDAPSNALPGDDLVTPKRALSGAMS